MRRPLGPLLATLLVLALAVSLALSETAGGEDATIGVRGHWVVEVRDPDGTPVTRREFHNGLVANGTIPNILAGQLIVGPMEIEVDCLGICVRPCRVVAPGGLVGVACRIVDPRLVGSSSLPPGGIPKAIFNTLTVTPLGNFQGFQLLGSAVVASDTTISFFSTAIHTCTGTTTTANCGLLAPIQGSRVQLTSTAISPMAVVTGQQVIVTVTITFATAPAAPQSVASPR